MSAADLAADLRDPQKRRAFAWLGRVGHAAVGVSYAIVASLALQLAIAGSGESTDRKGALAKISGTAWGWPLLLVIAVGFGSYAVWRLAVGATGRRMEDGRSIDALKRIYAGGRGLLYAFYTYATVRILTGGSASSGSGENAEKTATVLSWPGGRFLVAGIGIAFGVAAGFNVYRIVTKHYEEDLKTREIPKDTMPLVRAVAGYGLAARAMVFALIGFFLVRSAVRHDPERAIGLDGALSTIASQPYGRVLLGVFAAGLLAYAALRAIEARYESV